MLWTARDEGDHARDEDAKLVYYIEGEPLPDWETKPEKLIANGIWEKSTVRLYQKAAKEDNVHILRTLIKDSHVNPNLRDRKGWTALQRAAKCNSLGAAEWLCNAKADLEARNNSKATALHKAAKQGHTHMVDTLLHHGASANASNSGGANPLMFAVQKEGNNTVKLLIEGKSDVNFRKPDVGYTAMMLACRHGNLNAVNELLHHGADLEMKDVQGETALAKALKYERKDIGDYLLEHGSKPVPTPTVFKKVETLERGGKDSARMGREGKSSRGRSKSRDKQQRSSSRRSSSAGSTARSKSR